ncbi:hypothetical protein E2320_005715, partial [Naja naja]
KRGEKLLWGIMVESQVTPGVDFRATKEPQVVRIIVKTPWQKEEFLVHKDMLVREFKEHVARHLSSSPSQIVLVYTGRILKDHKSLAQHGIHLDSNAAVYVVVRSQQACPPQQVPTLPADVGPDPKASTRNGTFASDGLRELTASLGLNTANFTEFQSQLMSNPDLMLQLLENPFIQSKLSSPDLMKKMATKSPQIRQVIQRAPEISHVFSSPEGMRLLLELARNPAGCAGNHQAHPCPRSVPSGDGNTALQDVLIKVQGLVQKALPKRPAPTVWSGALGGHQPSFDQSDKTGRAKQQLLSPKLWPSRSSGQSMGMAAGNDHSKGESGNLRGETGQLASTAVKNLFHQIIKHLVQSMASSPPRNPTGLGLSSDVVGKAAQRYMAGSRNSREQILALLQQIQNTDVLLASWSPKEIQGLLEIQQRLQALATDEPVAERRGRSERPARRSYSITSLSGMVPPPGPGGEEDFSAPEIWQSLAADDFFCSPPLSIRLQGCSAQPPSSKQQTDKSSIPASGERKGFPPQPQESPAPHFLRPIRGSLQSRRRPETPAVSPMQAPSPPLPPPCAMEAMDLHQEGAPHGCSSRASNPNFICVTAKSPKGSTQFVLPRETPIRQFKEELSKHFQCETRQLVLVFFGRILRDQRTLRQCGISDGMTVHLVIRSLERDPEASAPTGTSLALRALSPSSAGSWGPLERNPSSMEWHQMPPSEMVVQKVRQLILANPEIQQLAQQFPAICHILNNMGIMRVILDKMREIMDLAKNPDVEQDLKNPEPLLISVQSNTPGGDNPLRQLNSEVQEPGPNAGQDPLGTPSPHVTLARNPPCPEHTARGGEGGGSSCSDSFPASNSYGRFCTNNSSNEEGGLSGSLPGPLGLPLPSLGPNPREGPCSVGGIQALIVNLCNTYTQRVMLSLMQNALLASRGSQADQQDHVQQQLQNFYQQMQRPEMVAAMSSPKAIQAWVQMEQGLQVLMEEAPVLIPWFVLRLKGLGPMSVTGAMAVSSPSEGKLAALDLRTLRQGRSCRSL